MHLVSKINGYPQTFYFYKRTSGIHFIHVYNVLGIKYAAIPITLSCADTKENEFF